MQKIIINEGSEGIGKRLDQFLHQTHYVEKSRSYVQHAIKEGYVLVDNEMDYKYKEKFNDLLTNYNSLS